MSNLEKNNDEIWKNYGNISHIEIDHERLKQWEDAPRIEEAFPTKGKTLVDLKRSNVRPKDIGLFNEDETPST